VEPLWVPLWFLFVKGKLKSVGHSLQVLVGVRTWVGYLKSEVNGVPDLPQLRKGILNPGNRIPAEKLNPERIKEINVVYAKDYRVFNDLLIITRNFRQI